MKQAFFTYFFLLLFLLSKGQVFRYSDLYHNSGITQVKRKGFSGSGGNGYWTLDKLDTAGRTIERKSYKKRKLLARTRYTYNSNNDITSEIHDKDVNNPNRIDTWKYSYEYNNSSKIVFQKLQYDSAFSTIYRMIENNGDSVFTYQDSTYRYLAYKNINLQYGHTLRLTYHNNLLTKQEYIEQGKIPGITRFEHYENGKLKRRTIERLPEESDMKTMYAGGPGADDQFYQYSYDKKGRVTTLYTVVEGKTYKLATYRYKQ